MKIGVLLEIKSHENRVALRPEGAEELSRDGHEVLVQAGAGTGSGFSDAQYWAAGARIVHDAEEVWQSDLVVKVKEPLPSEYSFLREGQTLFTYFHFAADEILTRAVMDSGAIALAYETVQEPNGALPLLIPMSEVAGRMAV